MGSSSKETTSSRNRGLPPPLRIVNWPLRDDLYRAWPMAAAWALVAGGVGALSQSVLMGLLSFVALSAAGWRLWIPVTFEFGTKGVVQAVFGRKRRIPWTEIARYEVRRRGVLLLADAEPTPLAALRSLYVRWNDRRDELLSALEFFITPRRTSSPSTTRTYNQ